ncbi:MAG: NAD(P)/FAD-dependent oxidoreductase [Thermoplasmatota archaeon]|nr:NAD(P)/FAD-dependent oxidoreductase [Candidatus Thermoplasmatota archaeon]MBU1914802.1 NAD(P)/FAD-dependent oxidoreductase [Candidatus Thermoplasmatota archaeon]
MPDYDVVVVGAGPAGSMTAKWAAKGGARVLMIEKRQEIGSPVRCGEGISRPWLDSVGVKLDSKSVAREVKGANIVAPNGTSFYLSEKMAGNEVGIVLDRVFFDKLLAHDAAKAGADLVLKTSAIKLLKSGNKVTGVKIKSFGETKDIKCGCVVGADGYESQVGRWAGINTNLAPRDITTCFQYRLTNINYDPDYCEFVLGSKAPGGYIWIFPKNEDTANVGIGMQLTKLKDPADVKKHLDRFVLADPRLKKGKPLELVSGAVSICAPIDKTVGDGVLLVGDAARQIDPITGGGISNSCKAGKVAGEVLAKATTEKNFSAQSLQRYEKGWRDLLENNLYRNWMAKEKLVTLTDDAFNKIIMTLNQVGVEKMSTFAILKAIQTKHPELVKEFQEFL